MEPGMSERVLRSSTVILNEGDRIGKKTILRRLGSAHSTSDGCMLYSHLTLSPRRVVIEEGSCILFTEDPIDENLTVEAAKKFCLIGLVSEIQVPLHVSGKNVEEDCQFLVYRLYRTSELDTDVLQASLYLEDIPSTIVHPREVLSTLKVAFSPKSRRNADFACFHVWQVLAKRPADLSKVKEFLPKSLAWKVFPFIETTSSNTSQETKISIKKRQSPSKRARLSTTAAPPLKNEIAMFDICDRDTWTLESIDWNS